MLAIARAEDEGDRALKRPIGIGELYADGETADHEDGRRRLTADWPADADRAAKTTRGLEVC